MINNGFVKLTNSLAFTFNKRYTFVSVLSHSWFSHDLHVNISGNRLATTAYSCTRWTQQYFRCCSSLSEKVSTSSLNRMTFNLISNAVSFTCVMFSHLSCSHSYGEYVFDHSWANAYYSYGSRYYPKLQCSVPFTPVTGPRILVRNTLYRDEVFDILVSSMKDLAKKVISGHVWHI